MFLPVQLATTASSLPHGECWIFEPKFDGYRCQLHFEAGATRLFTRNGQDWTDRFKTSVPQSVAPALQGSVVDTEICFLDEDGRPDYSAFCGRLGLYDATFTIFAFDLLVDRGEDIRSLPLIKRKRRLANILAELNCPTIQCVEHSSDGQTLVKTLRAKIWEGVMAKDASAPYFTGQRSPTWRKFKFTKRQEFLISGWRPDRVTGELKSVAIATYDNEQLRHHGFVASGFSRDERSRLATVFSKQPTAARPPLGVGAGRAVWIEPRFVAEVEFLEMTSAGTIRCGAFLGFRDDKSPAEVFLERAA